MSQASRIILTVLAAIFAGVTLARASHDTHNFIIVDTEADAAVASCLSEHYHLDETETRNFLTDHYADFRDHVDNSASVTVNRGGSTARSYASVTVNGDSNVSITERHRHHLDFINDKLTDAVEDGDLSWFQKTAIMVKLRELMDREPGGSAAYRAMDTTELNNRIAGWKEKMDAWMQEQGMRLSDLRLMTGKGNKYLMGIEY